MRASHASVLSTLVASVEATSARVTCIEVPQGLLQRRKLPLPLLLQLPLDPRVPRAGRPDTLACLHPPAPSRPHPPPRGGLQLPPPPPRWPSRWPARPRAAPPSPPRPAATLPPAPSSLRPPAERPAQRRASAAQLRSPTQRSGRRWSDSGWPCC